MSTPTPPPVERQELEIVLTLKAIASAADNALTARAQLDLLFRARAASSLVAMPDGVDGRAIRNGKDFRLKIPAPPQDHGPQIQQTLEVVKSSVATVLAQAQRLDGLVAAARPAE